jgi:hypothetical protein
MEKIALEEHFSRSQYARILVAMPGFAVGVYVSTPNR